jgi:hypothetical protein
MSSGGYESWFLSARDPGSPRALWIRHTRLVPRSGTVSAALWCTLADRDGGRPPMVVKQVFPTFPAEAAAGPAQFQGRATLGQRTAHWDLAITSPQPLLQPLRPAVLQRAPLPRTKLEASVPDGWITGTVGVDGRTADVSGWRATVGHNWGSEHADAWVWLHADFGTAPGGWLELVLARVRIGRARLPWTALGALSLDGERIPLGGLGRRPHVDASPGRLAAAIPSPGARLHLTVSTSDDDAVAVRYEDPSGGTRSVRHALLASVGLTLRRAGGRQATFSTPHGAYEYGTSQSTAEITPGPLPAG